MGFYISYKKEGKVIKENFGSYYFAIIRKGKLKKDGIEAEIKERKQYGIRNAATNTTSFASTAEREIAKDTLKSFQISPEYKQKLRGRPKGIRKGQTYGIEKN